MERLILIDMGGNQLVDSHNIKREHRIISGMKVMVPFYAFHDHKIWGATAMVLAEFLAIVEKAEKKEKNGVME